MCGRKKERNGLKTEWREMVGKEGRREGRKEGQWKCCFASGSSSITSVERKEFVNLVYIHKYLITEKNHCTCVYFCVYEHACIFIYVCIYVYACIYKYDGITYLCNLEKLKTCLTIVTQVYAVPSIFLKHSWAKPICKD